MTYYESYRRTGKEKFINGIHILITKIGEYIYSIVDSYSIWY